MKPRRAFGTRSALGIFCLAAAPLFSQGVLTILNSSLPPAAVGSLYAVALSAGGGTAPYAWSVSGNVPPGLTVYGSGTITGTPATPGSYTLTVTVTDSRQSTASKTLTLVVGGSTGKLSITTSGPLTPATAGQGYSIPLAAAGGTPPYRWAAGNGMPAGLTLDPQSGVLSGTPSTGGTYTFVVQVSDANNVTAGATFSLTVNAAPIVITTTAPLFAGTVGVAYSQSFSATGGKPPFTWSIAGGDTGGLQLDAASGTLRGTPQNAGTFTFTIQVADTAGAANSQSFSIVVNAPVLTITVGAQMPSGKAGVSYSQKLPVVANGGTPPYQWSLASGPSIAPGLDFSADTLTISGTPTTAGTFAFTVQVADSNHQTATRSMSLVIAPPALTITTGRALPDGALNAPYTSTLAAAGGAAPYSWSATGLPTGLSINSTTGVISGTPSSAGSFGIAITVADSTLANFADRFTLKINLPAAPPVSISGPPAAAAPAEQYPIQISLSSTYPAPITGQAILAFSPETGPVDKTVQFASGGTVANFSVPAGSTAAVSDVPMALQTGTVAGVINISVRLQAGGIDITPTTVPALTVQIARAAPVIAGAQVTRSSSNITLFVSGYSTAREVTQAVFTFTAASGQTLQTAASSISISLESVFSNWFQDPANNTYGSQFVLSQPFTIQGDPSAVIPQSVTLTNRTGSNTYQIQ